jgi:hypothetical protein
MMSRAISTSAGLDLPSSPHLLDLISHIGRPEFSQSLLEFLNDTIGADHCAVLRHEKSEMVKLCAISLDGSDTAGGQVDLYVRNYWRSDPTMMCAMPTQSSVTLQRLDLGRLPPSGLRDIVYRRQGVADRVLLRSASGAGITSLSVVRTERSGTF